MGGYEILEHTADIGLRAHGASLEETFEHATRGLAAIAGVWIPGEGSEIAVDVDADDLGALLVDWLSEILYLHDARGAAIARVHLDEVAGGRARGTVTLARLPDELSEGVQIKAVTYHQLRVEATSEGWTATVFFDI